MKASSGSTSSNQAGFIPRFAGGAAKVGWKSRSVCHGGSGRMGSISGIEGGGIDSITR
jgi:hypothetical protein